MAGFTLVLGGDDRVINNIFLGVQEGRGEFPKHTDNFCQVYDVFSTPEAYPGLLAEAGNRHSTHTYMNTPQPVWIEGNAYTGLAKTFREEKGAVQAAGVSAKIEQAEGEWILTVNIPESISASRCNPVTTQRLGMPRITEQPFENPDGTPIDFTKDFFGNVRSDNVIPGPFSTLSPGEHTFVVWR